MKVRNQHFGVYVFTALLVLCALLIPARADAATKPGKIQFIKVTTSNSKQGISKKAKSKGYRRVELSWTAAKNATRYQVLYSFKKNGTYKKATKEEYVSGSVAGKWRKCVLAYPRNKKVFFRVIPYNDSKKGSASDWVSVKVANEKGNASKVSINKYNKTVYVGATSNKFTGKANRGISKKVRWVSGNTKIATVGKNSGRVTGKKAGRVKIYAIAHNGVSKYITITVKKNTASRVNGLPAAPVLKYVTLRPQDIKDTKSKTDVCWSAIKGQKYQILRKSTGSYSVIATVKATSAKPTYVDKTGNVSTRYTYSVRMIEKNGTYTVKGKYDTAGIRTLPALKNLKVDAQNLVANLTWSSVSGASSYTVYRKVHKAGTYKALSTEAGVKYQDVYKKTVTLDNEKKFLCATDFIDPSTNPFIYQVRANSSSKDSNGNTKYSYSYYNADGYFELIPTAIVDFTFEGSTKGTLRWSPINRCDGYRIYRSKDGKHWGDPILSMKKIPNKSPQFATVPYDEDYPYYTVNAYSNRNGETILSSTHDEGFRVDFREEFKDKKVLFLGNSITYGSPYKGDNTRHIYSYPYRIAQLLGVKFFNPSIPGSTYSSLKAEDIENNNWIRKLNGITLYGQKSNFRRFRIAEEVAAFLRDKDENGEPVFGKWEKQTRDHFEAGADYEKYTGGLHVDLSKAEPYEAYDVVVMAAGTNDYGDSDPIASGDDFYSMTGAMNKIVGWIEEGSEKRIKNGKEPTKLVILDFFYSDRLDDYSIRKNRDITENDLGYTLADYQDQLDQLVKNYQEDYSGKLQVYQFKTRDYNFVTEQNCPYTSSDNLHMNRYTYTQIGNALADYLKENCF